MADKLAIRVCHLYYREHLTQAEIGARLALSHHKVGRILRDALAADIVRIEIRSPYRQTLELESELEAALNLKEAVIVDDEAGLRTRHRRGHLCALNTAARAARYRGLRRPP
jgi:DNA-binding transcriptional regulator LsrR (DeoR family)